jgi:hypothetical protein
MTIAQGMGRNLIPDVWNTYEFQKNLAEKLIECFII